MAILSGFPPSNTISPGVRIDEQDYSFIAPSQSFHRSGIVGFASKGPINIPTSITSTRQLTQIFGNPHPATGDPYLIYAAQQYLQVASELFVVRVANQDSSSDEVASTATVEVPVAGGPCSFVSSVAGPYVFGSDSFFSWSLNGIPAPKTLVVLAGTYSAAALVADLNAQLDPTYDGIVFAVATGGFLQVSTTFAYGPNASLELLSVQNAIYGKIGNASSTPTTSVTGLGAGMLPAVATGQADNYPNDSYHNPGTYDFTGLTNLSLQVVVAGTDNVLIDNVLQTINLSALEKSNTVSQVVTEINHQISLGNVPGGFAAYATGNNITLTTLASGSDSALLVRTAGAGSLMGFTGVTAYGTTPSGVTGDVAQNTYGLVNGSANSNLLCFNVNADSPGIEGNNTQVVITNDIRENVFSIAVFNNGVPVESWGNLTKDQQSSFYVESYITAVSSYISVADNTSAPANPLNGTYSLSGGTDGIPSDPDAQDQLLVGNSVAYTGMYALSEPEQIDIDLIACPGHASTTIVNALINLAEQRADCLAIIDPPFGLTVNEIVAWQNGVSPLNADQFDSDFAALYWPWLMINDTYNAVNVWVPPSGSVMATIAISDSIGAPWYAPAGLNRGVVPNIIDVFTRPTLSERDTMYGNSNAINPIITFPDIGGFVIWGQKTLQRIPTALDRVNVRRLMFVVEKSIRAACRTLLFDPNDAKFQARFETICTQILSEIQIGRGITAFIILDDASINTPNVIDRNEYRAKIGIQPTRAVEFIFIEFSVNRTGDFSQVTDTTF